MTEIEEVRARSILDSRGNVTVEVDVWGKGGHGRAAAPSGASTGKHEAVAWGKGGAAAAPQVFERALAGELVGMDTAAQRAVDGMLRRVDGTPDFSGIGGNLAVATSLAVARCAADCLGVPLWLYLGGAMPGSLPRPFGNVLGGGAHAVGGTSIQEFMAVAQGPTARENVLANAKVHARVKDILRQKLPNTAIGKGDEGAWVAPIADEEALAVVAQACDDVADEAGFPIRVALDVAASELWDGKKHYVYRGGQKRTREEQVDFIAGLVRDHGLLGVEDPFHEEDFEAFAALTKRVGAKCLVVGDDLLVTSLARIEEGIAQAAVNAVLIKPNQVGTLTDTIAAVRKAHEAGLKTIVSHRSGETPDDSIAHIAVAVGAVGLKSGAVGGERIAKLNELVRIEDEI